MVSSRGPSQIDVFNHCERLEKYRDGVCQLDAVGSGAELEVGVQVFFVVGEVEALEDGRAGELCREGHSL